MVKYDKQCIECGIRYNSKFATAHKVELTPEGRKLLGLAKNRKSITLLDCPKCSGTNIRDDKLNVKYAKRQR